MSNFSSNWAKIVNEFRAQFPNFYEKLLAFTELTRLNKPIGIYLLLWPTISALWIAAEGIPDLGLLLIFVMGTTIMRSAGCCVNDFADYNFDGSVGRTRERPLARGSLKRQDAFYCFGILSAAGFFLVLFTNLYTIFLSFGAVIIIVIYPFMKRYTNLPQLVLGVAFSWGRLMAFTAQTETIPQPALLLFAANIIWTIGYDTQYAMVDRKFDIKVGIKSTAILFGDMDKYFIALFQAMFIISMWFVGQQFELGWSYYLSLLSSCGLFAYQQYLIKDRLPDLCLKAFLNNNWVGAVIFVGVILNYV